MQIRLFPLGRGYVAGVRKFHWSAHEQVKEFTSWRWWQGWQWQQLPRRPDPQALSPRSEAVGPAPSPSAPLARKRHIHTRMQRASEELCSFPSAHQDLSRNSSPTCPLLPSHCASPAPSFLHLKSQRSLWIHFLFPWSTDGWQAT